MVRRTASRPVRCPATRGSPRAAAQRPLPSMMMAMCDGMRARSRAGAMTDRDEGCESLTIEWREITFPGDDELYLPIASAPCPYHAQRPLQHHRAERGGLHHHA